MSVTILIYQSLAGFRLSVHTIYTLKFQGGLHKALTNGISFRGSSGHMSVHAMQTALTSFAIFDNLEQFALQVGTIRMPFFFFF